MISKSVLSTLLAVLALRDSRLCAAESAAPPSRGRRALRRLPLCVGYIPDPTRVEYCLRQNKLDLSDACRSVFEQSAGLQAEQIPPGEPTTANNLRERGEAE